MAKRKGKSRKIVLSEKTKQRIRDKFAVLDVSRLRKNEKRYYDKIKAGKVRAERFVTSGKFALSTYGFNSLDRVKPKGKTVFQWLKSDPDIYESLKDSYGLIQVELYSIRDIAKKLNVSRISIEGTTLEGEDAIQEIERLLDDQKNKGSYAISVDVRVSYTKSEMILVKPVKGNEVVFFQPLTSDNYAYK